LQHSSSSSLGARYIRNVSRLPEGFIPRENNGVADAWLRMLFVLCL